MRFYLKLALIALLGVATQVSVEFWSVIQCEVRIGTPRAYIIDNEATEKRRRTRLKHCTCITRAIFAWCNPDLA